MKSLAYSFQRDAQQGLATAAGNPNVAVAVANNFNDFSTNNQIELIFVADNVNAAASSTIGLFPGTGKGRITALPAGVTVGGDYTDIADFYNYITNNAMKVTNIFMQSADTTNYAGRLTVGMIQPNGKIPGETYKQLTDYRESTGNGYSDVINIKDLKLVTIPKLYAKFDIKKNTTIRVILTVESCVESASLTPINF